jgi:hypothetical protein
VSADAPCYLLFHLSSPSGWLIITYIPETVKVSDKMVYAATKSRLKTELGNHTFVDEMHANEPVPHTHNTQTHKHTNTQTHKHTNTQTHNTQHTFLLQHSFAHSTLT